MLVPMIVARSGAERGNNEWLEKLQCSRVVPIIVKSVPLCSVGTGKCTNDCGTEQSGDWKYSMAREKRLCQPPDGSTSPKYKLLHF